MNGAVRIMYAPPGTDARDATDLFTGDDYNLVVPWRDLAASRSGYELDLERSTMSLYIVPGEGTEQLVASDLAGGGFALALAWQQWHPNPDLRPVSVAIFKRAELVSFDSSQRRGEATVWPIVFKLNSLEHSFTFNFKDR